MPTSFLSEHSVEYCIVPQMCRIVEECFIAIPLYFWSTREGSRLARECSMDEQLRVLVLFARRPKVLKPNDDIITMKVNTELQRLATDSEQHGIPVFCGMPLISSILDFGISSPCCWFRIVSQADNPEDMNIQIDRHSGNIVGSSEIVLKQSQEDILQSAKTANLYKWPDVVDVIKELRSACMNNISSRFIWFSSVYKPVYLLLVDRV